MSWQASPLGVIADTQLGKMLDAKKNDGEYRPYLGNDNVQWDGIDLSEVKEMRFKDSELPKFALKTGDLLVCEGGDPGRCAIWNSYEEMYYQKALHRVRAQENVLDNRFLYYYLVYICSTQEIRQYYTGGATIKHLPKAALERVIVRYPDLETQSCIADVLSAYDELIENNRKQIKLLEEAAQRLYKEWFVDLKFPGHETTSIVDGLPEGWKKESLLSQIDYVRGRSYRSEDLRGARTPKLINLSNIASYGGWNAGAEKSYSDTYKENQVVAAGDIVMAVTDMTKERRLVGHVARVPKGAAGNIISMDLIKIVPQAVEPNYLYAYLRFSGIAEMIAMLANGTNVAHLKPESLIRAELLVPSRGVQLAYGSYVQAMFDGIENAEQQIASAREARNRLLPKLMSGEIEV
ncbi:restriction endonuclease subunit S [Enorma sp.]|uniref:restriction endonuclease subunit S n=1 Tax=Enorma sp. TaxID=1920692 RepID=UPI0025C44D5E|nr:restriction endonuclease subunit S [Enorma sp.]